MFKQAWFITASREIHKSRNLLITIAVALAALIPCTCTLLGTAIAVMSPDFSRSITNPLPHGFSQVLYAFSSAANKRASSRRSLPQNISVPTKKVGAPKMPLARACSV